MTLPVSGLLITSNWLIVNHCDDSEFQSRIILILIINTIAIHPSSAEELVTMKTPVVKYKVLMKLWN